MSQAIPGYDDLPLRRRARVQALSALARVIVSRPGAREGLLDARERAPSGLVQIAQRMVAPLRLGAPSPARLAIDELPSPRARALGAPRATVIIPTRGAATLPQCLAAIEAFTTVPYELLVVADGVPAPCALGGPDRVLERRARRGFVACANEGARRARAESLVFLNDDAVVTPGWLGALLAELEEPRVGMVGPRSNDSGDAATVRADYGDLAGLCAFAGALGGPARSVEKLSLFCAATRRATFERLGGLDEGYGWGGFEDDELCAALRRRGLRVVLAGGAFVHHHGSATFGAMEWRERIARFEVNRYRFERRTGVRWRAP